MWFDCPSWGYSFRVKELNLVAWRNYFQFCLEQSFNSYGDPGRNSPVWTPKVPYVPNLESKLLLGYRLPISRLMFFLELLNQPSMQKSSDSYATFCDPDQPSFGGGVPFWIELLEKFAAYLVRVVAVYTLPLTPIGTLHLRTSSIECDDSPACVWGALGRRKASPLWAVPGSQVHASAQLGD